MLQSLRRLLFVAALVCTAQTLAGEPPPLAAFANPYPFLHPRISPDGKHLVYLDRSTEKFVVAMMDLGTTKIDAILVGEVGDFSVTGCWFKNDTRLLCHFAGTDMDMGHAFNVTRLLALDIDGKNQKVLVQNGRAGGSQFQDRIVDELRDDPRNVLIELDDDANIFPSVFKLDIYTGKMERVQSDRTPIMSWSTDRDGIVRFGYGEKGGQSSYIARDSATAPWRTLLKFQVFDNQKFSVYGFGVLPNKLIVAASKDGRDAVWEMDLADQSDRQLLFANATVDVDGPVHWPNDDRLVGFAYETDKPHLQLFDGRAIGVQDAIDKTLPGTVNRVISGSRDDQRLVISSESDLHPVAYFLLDLKQSRLQRLSPSPKQLTPANLAPMKPVTVKAADGAEIPGYLTLPVGRDQKNLPAVVLPHGGPYARDSWGFDPLVQMLASRGYAALIGAIKAAPLYQCIVSIAGVSDMRDLAWDNSVFYDGRRMTEMSTGTTDREENSPLKRATEIKLPVLLVHGTWDVRVNVDHSKSMARALTSAGNATKLVLIEHGDHSLSKPAMRLTLFQNLEQFLAAHLQAR